jgi:DNA polymerase-3 subunit alpha
VLEQALAWGGKQHADRLAGQGSIFDLGLDDEPAAASAAPRHHPPIPPEEYEKQELLALEKEVLGLYVSEHPLHGIRDQLRRKVDLPVVEVSGRRDGDVVSVGGIVGAIRSLTTRKGEPMAFVRLDDLSGSVEVIVFNSAYAAARELLETDRVLLVKGRVDHKDGETKLIALEVSAFEAVPERREVLLRVDARRAQAGTIRELAELVRGFPGESPVLVALETSGGPRTLQFGPGYRVRPEPDFFAEVKALLGEAAVA